MIGREKPTIHELESSMIRREKTHTYNDLQCISNVKISTMWCRQAISLFIDPINCSYKYNKP